MEGKKKKRDDNWYHQQDINRYIKWILEDAKEVKCQKEIAIKALGILARGYGYPGKHPIIDAIEKIFENMS